MPTKDFHALLPKHGRYDILRLAVESSNFKLVQKNTLKET